MNVGCRRRWMMAVLAGCVLSWTVEHAPSALAASAKKKEVPPSSAFRSAAAKSIAPSANALRAQSGLQGRSPAMESNPKPVERDIRQARRQFKKRNRKHRSPAIIEAKPDLSFLGILEGPHRYDSRLGHRKGGRPSPQVGNVLHDQFQELDKNHDGAIDPLERAISRIDLDRDL